MPMDITNIVREYDGYWKEKMSAVFEEIRIFWVLAILEQCPYRDDIQIVSEASFHTDEVVPNPIQFYYREMDEYQFGVETRPSYHRNHILYLNITGNGSQYALMEYFLQFSDLSVESSAYNVSAISVPDNYSYTMAIHIEEITYTPECSVWIYF